MYLLGFFLCVALPALVLPVLAWRERRRAGRRGKTFRPEPNRIDRPWSDA